MKRIIAFAVSMILLVSVFSATAGAQSNVYDNTFTVGNVDDSDNSVNLKDLFAIKCYLAGICDLSAINSSAADLFADGKINGKDSFLLKMLMSGMITQESLENGHPLYSLTIAGNSIDQYRIVLPSDAVIAEDSYNDDCCVTAARRMREYLWAATGHSAGMVLGEENNDLPHMIRYIQYDPEDAEAQELGLGNEGYVYEVKDGDLYIYGTLRGTLYATYEILEKYMGIRFFDDEYTYFYKQRAVDIPADTYVSFVPALEYRYCGSQVRSIPSRYSVYYALRMNGTQLYCDGGPAVGYQVGPVSYNAHSFNYYWQMGTGTMPDEDFGTLRERLEEKFRTGVVVDNYTWQPCGTTENTYQTLFSGLTDHLRLENTKTHKYFNEAAKYGCACVSFSICDNGNYCSCRRCNAVVKTEGYSGLYVALANRAVNDLQEYIPGMKVFMIIYDHTVPKTVRPDEKLVLMYCGNACNNHYLGSGDCGDCKTLLGANNNADDVALKEWARICHESGASIWFWTYYVTNNFFVGGACPNIPNIYYDLKYIICECGFDGVYHEGDDTKWAYSFERLKAYLCAKMMWEPDMTYEQYIEYLKEFLYMYYGNGYDELYEYILMQTEAGDLNPCFINNFDRPGEMYNYGYIAENYEYMRSLLLSAREKVNFDWQAKNIDYLMMSCDFLGLSCVYDDMYTNGTEDSRALYEERYTALLRFIWDNDVELYWCDLYEAPKTVDLTVNPMTQFYEIGSRRPGIYP